jgi:hypothetical protein
MVTDAMGLSLTSTIQTMSPSFIWRELTLFGEMLDVVPLPYLGLSPKKTRTFSLQFERSVTDTSTGPVGFGGLSVLGCEADEPKPLCSGGASLEEGPPPAGWVPLPGAGMMRGMQPVSATQGRTRRRRSIMPASFSRRRRGRNVDMHGARHEGAGTIAATRSPLGSSVAATSYIGPVKQP